MVCNRATSPSTSQGGQLPSLRNESTAARSTGVSFGNSQGKPSYQTCFQQTKLRFIIGEAQQITFCAKTYFFDTEWCHLMHVKTAAPIIFYVSPHTGGEAQLSYFPALMAVNTPGKRSLSELFPGLPHPSYCTSLLLLSK